MSTRKGHRARWRLGGAAALALWVAGSLPDVRAVGPDDPPATDVTPEAARKNPDLPGFLDGAIDMEAYLRARSDAVGEHRGIPYAAGKKGPANPRAAAIKKMEAQERRSRALRALSALGLPPQAWEPVGPAPIPNGQTTTRSDPVSGRTTAIAVDPADANVAYVGTAQGGVYRTLDGGATWTAIFDTAQSLAIGALAVAPSNPDIVYVGTGEPGLTGDSFFGVGLYRVDNAKTTADLTGPINPAVATGIGGTTAFTGRAISEILVHPTDPAVVFVSTTTGVAGLGATALGGATAVPPLAVLGVYRSANATSAGPSFEKIVLGLPSGTRLVSSQSRTENSRVMDMIFEPGNPNTLLVSVYGGPPQGGSFGEGGIWRSTNALAASPTFSQRLALTNGIRIELAINKVGSTVTVVAATGESASFTGSSCTVGFGAVRKSVDGGATWSLRLPGGAGFCGTQCFYDIAVEVDPNDADLIYLGGSANGTCSRVYARSTDGGTSFVPSDDGLHADTHALAAAPGDPAVVYTGNDGGIWRSTDSARTWTSLNNDGFNATQFQSLALHPVDREFLIGGTQDNGTQLRRPDATWLRADFGDGGFALVDQGATDTENVTLYHTYFNQTTAMGYGRVTRTSDAFEGNWEFFGCGFVPGTNGLNCSPPATSILFYAPMALGPGVPNTLYFGSDRLFRSTDRGATMVLASQGPIQSGVAVSAIGISPQDDNVRLVGMRFGKVWATATGASPLVDVTGPWPTSASLASQPRRFVSRAVIDPSDSDVAYVTFATYCGGAAGCAQVYKTTNLVTALLASATPTWTASASGLPDVPVSAFAIDPRDPLNLFAGTDIGVYSSTDGGATWAPYGTGLPRVAVFDMALHAPTGTLRVATHGRGIWEIAAGLATPVLADLASPTIGPGSDPTLLTGVVKAGSLVPPGSVDITLDGSTNSAPIDPATGFFSASFATGGLAAGSYPIAYSYPGASGYASASGSGTLVVSAALAPTSTAIDAPAAAYPNASVTVTVTSPAGSPAGDVELAVDGGAPLTQPLAGGAATFVLPAVPVGTHTLFASYAAQGAFGGSSATASLVVSKGVPTFTATSPSVAAGQTPVVLSGTLKAGSAVPTGSVSITLDGVTQTATPNPSSGAFSSTFATGTLPAGAHPVTLAYAGDANFEAASGEATLYVVPAVLTTTFANPAAITINDFAPGSPSPSVISVSGLFGKVLKATVTLRGLTHTFVGDTAFLLVGPDGTSTVLLYHVGGSSSVSGLDLAFDDAGDPVPAVMAAGTYRPTQTGLVSSFQTGGAPGPDPPPAPYGTTLFAHNGAGPNGDWRLYAQDDSGSDSGSVASGWELTLTTAIEPAASIDDVVVAEGGDAVFTVSLSSPPAFPVDVDYATAAGTATAGADFVTASGTVRFDPLQTSQALTVATVPDAEAEPAETFYVDLTSPVNATLLDAQGMGTITDDDPHATLADVEKPEGHAGTTSFVFTVTLTAPPGVPVSVAYSTAPLTATPGRDYTAVSGVLTFAAGETSGRITVPVVADRIEEQDELFKVVLSGPSGLFIDRPEALGRIVNDDFVGLPKISIYDASLVEGDSGSANMVFTVRMSRVSSTVVTLRYATASGTAVAGSDYAPTGGTLFFPIGVKERTVSVPVIGDLLDEPTEAFFVNLSAPRGAALLDGQAKGAILDDDP